MDKQKTIGIIGFGRFGSLAASILGKQATVFIYQEKITLEIKKRVKKINAHLASLEELANCDYIIIAVPISKTELMIKKLAPIVKPGTLVMDACSVKTYPCQWLKKYLPKDIETMGTHPMFGPVTTKFDFNAQTWVLADKQIVLCPLRISEKKLQEIKKFLEGLGLEVIITTPADHDKQNAKTLSLVHFLGRALVKAKIKEQKIFTPGYTDLLKIIPHTASDNWQLFFDMHNYNPFALDIRRKFISACKDLEEKIIKSQSSNEFDYNRKMINKIDKEIFALVAQRLKHTRIIGKIKKEKGLPILDKKREKEIIENKIKSTKLNPAFIKNLYQVILRESYKTQK